MFEFLKRKEKNQEESEPKMTSTSLKAAMTRESNRAKQLQIQRLKDLNDTLEARRMEQKIEDLEAELYGDDDETDDSAPDSPDQMLMQLLYKGFLDRKQQSANMGAAIGSPPSGFSTPQNPQQPPPIPDEQVLAYVNSMLEQGAISKAQLKWFKKQRPAAKKAVLDNFIHDEHLKQRIIEVVV